MLVLGLLARDVDVAAIRAVLADAQPAWLAVALLLKSITLGLHEIRLWAAFPKPRPPAARVVAIGFIAGLFNLVLPGRAGDIAAIAMLRKECDVGIGAASAAVGVVAFLEAAVFGLLLIGVLVLGASRWEQVIGVDATAQAMEWVTIATLGGIAVAVGIVIVGRRLTQAGRPPADAPPSKGPIQVIREAITHTSDRLSSPRSLGLNTGLATIQVVGMVASFAVALPAVGLDVPMPWLAAAGVLAISSLAAVVLPPTYGAGPAAAAVAVLAVFGVDTAGALAYAAAWWVISQVPAVVLGIGCMGYRSRRAPLQ